MHIALKDYLVLHLHSWGPSLANRGPGIPTGNNNFRPAPASRNNNNYSFAPAATCLKIAQPLRHRCCSSVAPAMTYNTRRKSISLSAMGIAIPKSSRSPPSTLDQPPSAKRVKRTHSISSNASTPDSPPRPSTLRFDERPQSSGNRVAENTPPPSPGGLSGQTKVDTQGIDDIIVVGVIEQLEKTGNRPHLLKELAAVLSSSIPIVER